MYGKLVDGWFQQLLHLHHNDIFSSRESRKENRFKLKHIDTYFTFWVQKKKIWLISGRSCFDERDRHQTRCGALANKSSELPDILSNSSQLIKFANSIPTDFSFWSWVWTKSSSSTLTSAIQRMPNYEEGWSKDHPSF